MKKKIFHSKPSIDSLHKSTETLRLNKFIAHCGICSRREAAELVKNGQITLNGNIFTNPAYEVQEDDEVMYKDKVIRLHEKGIYLLLNKPKNVITTMDDERGRKTVFDLIRSEINARVYPVGRLDRNTTGLLLLTNDGDLAQKLSHPSHKIKKMYHVTLTKPVSKRDLENIINGVKLEDGIAEVDGIDYANDKKNEVGIEIHVGKNRIVRRIFEHLGYEIEKLDRVFYAGLTKKNIARGKFRHLTDKEIIQLKHLKH